MPNRPKSAFSIGQRVRIVRAGEKGLPRLGIIRDVLWHFQAERYHYYLEADGQKIARQYSEQDLEVIEEGEGGDPENQSAAWRLP